MAHHNQIDSNRIGIVGAGTMGSGIALAALLVDLQVSLYDVEVQTLDKAYHYISTFLEKKKRSLSLKYLSPSSQLETLRGAGVIIEAVPEKLELKGEVFRQLSALCPPGTVFATNTSTLAVTAIAAYSATPEQVGGMHFFNPAPVMPLVEVVQGAQTSPATLQRLVDLAKRLGKTPVVAGDTPGFIVNRVARPFYGEALRLLGERVATHAQIDRIVTAAGGFRMGPFQLMDLIGLDVNLAATQSIYAQTFFEARYRPHWIQNRLVDQRALGRKTGAGFYSYSQDGREPEASGQNLPSSAGTGNARLPLAAVLLGPGSWAPGLREMCQQAGYTLQESHDPGAAPGLAVVAAGRNEDLVGRVVALDRALPAGVPILCQCADASLLEIASGVSHPERVAGFDGLFFSNGPVTTLVDTPRLAGQARTTIEAFLTSLGREPVWIADSPGLVLPRIVAMLANEAAFAVGEGVAPEETIDLAMRLGVNYPHGPLEWARQLGFERVAQVLDHLRAEYGEERYRTAPLLRRWARLTRLES